MKRLDRVSPSLRARGEDLRRFGVFLGVLEQMAGKPEHAEWGQQLDRAIGARQIEAELWELFELWRAVVAEAKQ